MNRTLRTALALALLALGPACLDNTSAVSSSSTSATLGGATQGATSGASSGAGTSGASTTSTGSSSVAASGTSASTDTASGTSGTSSTLGTSATSSSTTTTTTSGSSSSGTTTGGLLPICAGCGVDADCASGFCNDFSGSSSFCDANFCLADPDCASGGVTCDTTQNVCACPQVGSTTTGTSGTTTSGSTGGTTSGCAPTACPQGDDPSKWTNHSPNPNAETGYALGFALDACGAPHLVYDEALDGGWVVRHAVKTGTTAWQVETIFVPVVPDGGYGNSYALAAALDDNGAMHVVRMSGDTRKMDYLTNASGTWVDAPLPSDGTLWGGQAITTDSAGRVFAAWMFIADGGDYALDLSQLQGGTWVTEQVPDGPFFQPDIGANAELASDGHTLFITAPLLSSGAELITRWEDGGWSFSKIDTSSPRNNIAIALDASDTPRVAYGRPFYSSALAVTEADLICATPEPDGGWSASTAARAGSYEKNADGLSAETSSVSLAVRADGGLDIAYQWLHDPSSFQVDLSLRVASFPGDDGGWVIHDVEAGDWPESIRMARDPSGHLVIAATSDLHGPWVFTEGCR